MQRVINQQVVCALGKGGDRSEEDEQIRAHSKGRDCWGWGGGTGWVS